MEISRIDLFIRSVNTCTALKPTTIATIVKKYTDLKVVKLVLVF